MEHKKVKDMMPVFLKVSAVFAVILIAAVLVRQIYNLKISGNKVSLTGREIQAQKNVPMAAETAPPPSAGVAAVKRDKSTSGTTSLPGGAIPAAAPASKAACVSDKAIDASSRREMAEAEAVPNNLKEESSLLSVPGMEQKTVYSGQQSGNRTPGTIIVKDKKGWEKVSANAKGIIEENPWLSKLDFSAQTAAVVFMGEKQTSGYSVVINCVREESGKIVVGYTENGPSKGAITAQVISTPYSIVIMGRSGKHIEFLKQQE